MKIIGVVTLGLGVASILSYGPGVPTQNISTGYNTHALAFGNDNNTTAAASGGSSITLNPPHGQPGHRCDIKVGQPLDSKPTLPSPKLNIPAASLLPIVPSNGLNPKHGEPGHRCDIAVGQPLNSKPPQAAGTGQQSNAIATATAAAGVPPLLNPKHGQPFHRCDIMVGQPLDSKPTIPAAKPTTPFTSAPPVSVSTNSNATPPLLNPKHGQPFHRCDIMVGQPLNSKPTLPAIAPVSSSPLTPLKSAANTKPLYDPKK